MTDYRDDPDLDRCLCGAVRQAARRLSQHYDAALAPVGISINQYSMLARAARLGPRTIADLAAALVMDRSTLGHLLRPLQKRGLVHLAASPEDRRRTAITLTPAGTTLLAAARPLWADAQRRFLAHYGNDAAKALRDQLDDVSKLAIPGPPRPPQTPSSP